MNHPANLLQLTIETNSAAFHEDGADESWELSRIVSKVAACILDGAKSGKCYDTNGAHVGSWEIG